MRRWILPALLLLLSTDCLAQSRGTGIGVIMGEPTGLSLKKWTSRETAWDAALAWSFEGEDSFHVHADYLLHRWGEIDFEDGSRWPVYFGVGGRVKFTDDATLGVRGVIGINHFFDSVPVDFFLEVVPILDLAPDTDVTLNAALGLRLFLNQNRTREQNN